MRNNKSRERADVSAEVEGDQILGDVPVEARPITKKKPSCPCMSIILRVFIYTLILAGLATMIYGAYIFTIYTDKVNEAGSTPNNSTSTNQTSTDASIPDFEDIHWSQVPWIIYGFIAVGSLTLFSGLVGMAGLDCDYRSCLCCFQVLIIVVMLIQGAFMFVVMEPKHFIQDLPEDNFDKAEEEEIQQLLLSKGRTPFLIASISILVIEVVLVCFTGILSSITGSHKYSFTFEDLYAATHGGPPVNRAPLLPNEQQQRPAGTQAMP